MTPSLLWEVWAQELDDAARLEAERKAAEEKAAAEHLEAEILAAEHQMDCELAAEAAERQAASEAVATSKAAAKFLQVATAKAPASASTTAPKEPIVVFPPPRVDEEGARLTRAQKKLQRRR